MWRNKYCKTLLFESRKFLTINRTFTLSSPHGSTLSAWPKRRFPVIDGTFSIAKADKDAALKKLSAIVESYAAKEALVLAGGGKSAIMRHTLKNKKLLARHRIAKLLDPDYPVLEIGRYAGLGLEYGDIACAGMIVVIGKISGQLCIIGANDASVKGGTIYPIGVKKQARMQEIAAENNIPCVYVIDSGGGFLPLQAEVFNPGGRIFYNEAVMNAAGTPQICMVAGSCTAGAAYIPTMAQEVVMVNDIATIFLAGPPLVYAAIGELVSDQDLGGAAVHCDVSGCADYRAADEHEAIETTKDIMSTLNMDVHVKEARSYEEPRFCDEGLNILQFIRDENKSLLTRHIIARLVDGSRFHEYKPTFGKEIISGFARLTGVLIGVVANNGKFTADACLKACNFVRLCEERGIPLLFLHDTQANTDTSILKQLAALMTAVATAKVPKITLVVGNSVDVGRYAMCGRSMSPRFLFTWPTSKTAIDDTLDSLAESEAFYGSGRLWDDGVVLPAESRKVLSSALLACVTHQNIEKSSQGNIIRM